jgi:hypothetical protein
MAQVVSRRPLTVEVRIRARINPRWICGPSGTGTDSSPSYLIFPCQYHSTVPLCTHIQSGGWTISPLVPAVQRHEEEQQLFSHTHVMHFQSLVGNCCRGQPTRSGPPAWRLGGRLTTLHHTTKSRVYNRTGHTFYVWKTWFCLRTS